MSKLLMLKVVTIRVAWVVSVKRESSKLKEKISQDVTSFPIDLNAEIYFICQGGRRVLYCDYSKNRGS